MNKYKKSKFIVNWFDYYLLKWRIKSNSCILLNTKPDMMMISLNKDFFLCKQYKGLLKAVFRLINEDRLEYFNKENMMVLYNSDKMLKYKSQFDFASIESIEKLIDLKIAFEHFDSSLFLVKINSEVKILIRKHLAGDVVAISDIFFQDEYAILKPYLRNAVVLDIGAYIGDSILKFICEGARKIYAYEPHPDLYKIALKNIEINNITSQVELKNFGVSDKKKELVVFEDTKLGPTPSFGLEGNKRFNKVHLKLLSLEDVINSIGDIDIMKMDCEGAEFSSILSCSPKALRRIKRMIIEYHKEPEVLIEYLNQSGFNVSIFPKNDMRNKIGLLFAANNTCYG